MYFLSNISFLLHQYLGLFFDDTLRMRKQAIFIEIYWTSTLIIEHSLMSYSKGMLIFENFKHINFWIFEHSRPCIFLLLILMQSVVWLYSNLDCNSCFFTGTTQIENFTDRHLISNGLFFLLGEIVLGESPSIKGNSKCLEAFIELSLTLWPFNLQAAAI